VHRAGSRLRSGTAIACSIIALLVLTPAFLRAWEWPIAEFDLLRNFGVYKDGYAFPGAQLTGGHKPTPIHQGELVFRSTGYDGLRGIQAPLGSMVAIDHERGFRSVYTHLDPQIVTALEPAIPGDVTLGPPGSSGYVREANALRLEILDMERGVRVNPALLLPRYGDTTAPVVQELSLQVGGQLVPVDTEPEQLPTGRYQLVVEAWDIVAPGPGAPRLAPYRFILETGDAERSVVELELETVRGGVQHLNGERAYRLMVGPFQYAIGELEVDTEPRVYRVTVEDHHGNSTTREFSVQAAETETTPDEPDALGLSGVSGVSDASDARRAPEPPVAPAQARVGAGR